MNRNETFSATETHTIQMDMVRASISVQTCEADEIRLMVSGDDESVGLLHLEWSEGKLSLSMPIRDRVPNLMSPAWMQIVLRLPRSWKGGMELHSQSGAVSVTDFSGTDLIISTVSGHIRAERILCITTDLHSISGILLLEQANIEEIKLSTISGNILATEVSCDRMHISTVSGSTELNLSTGFTELTGNAATGDTHISVPLSEVNATLMSVTGRILTRNISIQESGPNLHFNSVSGHLEIVGDLPYLNASQQEE